MIPEGLKDYYNFLEDLRKSGKTNMYGAVPYLQKAFGLGRKDATDILLSWMKDYDPADYKRSEPEDLC